MTPKQFLKQKELTVVDKGFIHYPNGGDYINERIIINLMDGYHQAKLKEVKIGQLKDFLDYCDRAGWIKNVDKDRIISDYQSSL